jgi:CheY-like chemotaxis protein
VAAGIHVADILKKPVQADVLLDALRRARGTSDGTGPILVVDDDPKALKLAQAVLRGAGYETRCCRSAKAALRAIAGKAPSLVVLDLVMPGMSGFELLKRLRQRSTGGWVPVIVWTGKDLSREEREQLVRQAQAVVAKQDGLAMLVAGIQAHVPAHPTARR